MALAEGKMANVTVLHKQIRVSKFNKNLSKNLAKHDLRLQKPEEMRVQCITSKSHLNTYTFRGEPITTESQRLQALQYIESLSENDNDNFDNVRFSHLKYKIKKWLDNPKTTDAEKNLFQKIIDAADEKKNTSINADIALERLESVEKVSRFNDKKRAISELIELHNQRKNLNIDQESQMNARMVSVMLKIPGHNEHDIAVEQQESLINQYYKDNFPNYEIILSTVHKDEVDDHTHLIIDAKNNETNKFDFVQRQYEYIKEKADLSAFPALYSKLTTGQLVTVGELLQDDFYTYSNNFLKELGCTATFAKKEYDSPEHKAIEREKIKSDTNKPIAEREYNTANYYAEKKKQGIQAVSKLMNVVDNYEKTLKQHVEDAYDYAIAFSQNLFKNSIQGFTDAIAKVMERQEELAQKVVDDAVEIQQTDEQKLAIRDAHKKAKKHKFN